MTADTACLPDWKLHLQVTSSWQVTGTLQQGTSCVRRKEREKLWGLVPKRPVQVTDSPFHICRGNPEKRKGFLFFFPFWLRWVFVAVRGLLIAVASLVAEHGL